MEVITKEHTSMPQVVIPIGGIDEYRQTLQRRLRLQLLARGI